MFSWGVTRNLRCRVVEQAAHLTNLASFSADSSVPITEGAAAAFAALPHLQDLSLAGLTAACAAAALDASSAFRLTSLALLAAVPGPSVSCSSGRPCQVTRSLRFHSLLTFAAHREECQLHNS